MIWGSADTNLAYLIFVANVYDVENVFKCVHVMLFVEKLGLLCDLRCLSQNLF